MRCKACNRPIESVRYYKRLNTHEDLCRRCFGAAASAAHDIDPRAAASMNGRLWGHMGLESEEKERKGNSLICPTL